MKQKESKGKNWGNFPLDVKKGDGISADLIFKSRKKTQRDVFRYLLVARRNGDLTRTHTWERTMNFFRTTWTILTELYRIFNFFSDHAVDVCVRWNRTYDGVFSFWNGLDSSSSLDLEEKETALGACRIPVVVSKNKRRDSAQLLTSSLGAFHCICQSVRIFCENLR